MIQKHCHQVNIVLIDSISVSDSTIHSLDSLKIVLRSFDELINEDSLILFDNTALNFSGGFGIIDNWDEDSLELYTNIKFTTKHGIF